MSNRGLLIFVEGSFELAFFKAVVKAIQDQNTSPIVKHPLIIYKQLSRIGDHQNNAIRIFRSQVLIDYSGVSFDVILCHDSTIVEFSPKPPIDWRLVRNKLISAGAKRVYHILADKTIEDWILLDYYGVLRYLNLPQDTIISGNDGITKLRNLYKKANNVYLKGGESNALVEHLDITKINANIHNKIKPLIKLLN